MSTEPDMHASITAVRKAALCLAIVTLFLSVNDAKTVSCFYLHQGVYRTTQCDNITQTCCHAGCCKKVDPQTAKRVQEEEESRDERITLLLYSFMFFFLTTILPCVLAVCIVGVCFVLSRMTENKQSEPLEGGGGQAPVQKGQPKEVRAEGQQQQGDQPQPGEQPEV